MKGQHVILVGIGALIINCSAFLLLAGWLTPVVLRQTIPRMMRLNYQTSPGAVARPLKNLAIACSRGSEQLVTTHWMAMALPKSFVLALPVPAGLELRLS